MPRSERTVERLEARELDTALDTLMALADLRSGDHVLLKPNFVSMDAYPYTTALDVIEGVLRRIPDRCKISVIDGPAPDKCRSFDRDELPLDQRVALSRGYNDDLRRACSLAEHCDVFLRHSDAWNSYSRFLLERCQFNSTLAPFGLRWSSIDSFRAGSNFIPLKLAGCSDVPVFDLGNFDKTINLPVLKRHTTVGFTAGVKNMYGLVHPQYKGYFHTLGAIPEVLTDLQKHLVRHQVLTLLDARQVPDAQQRYWGHGKIWQAGKLLVSADLQACDLAASQIVSAGPFPTTPENPSKRSRHHDCQ